MATHTTCDHCKKTILDVAYVVTPTNAQTRQPVSKGYDLHYDCLIPWRESDK